MHDAGCVLRQWNCAKGGILPLRFGCTHLHTFHISDSTVNFVKYEKEMQKLNCSSFHCRYADIIVHRLLAACIGADSTYSDLLDKRKSALLCNNLNYRNRMAQYAGRASVSFEKMHTH